MCVHMYIHYQFGHLHAVALEYNAQSPDEAALVSAARNFGYVFLVTTVAIL